jgi:hypothetical protein
MVKTPPTTRWAIEQKKVSRRIIYSLRAFLPNKTMPEMASYSSSTPQQ